MTDCRKRTCLQPGPLNVFLWTRFENHLPVSSPFPCSSPDLERCYLVLFVVFSMVMKILNLRFSPVLSIILALGTALYWSCQRTWGESLAGEVGFAPPVSQDHSTLVSPFPAWWSSPPSTAQLAPCKDAGNCVKCHEENAMMDPTHAFACVRCHGGDPAANETTDAHEGMLRDPGDLAHVDKTCGKCHPEEVRRVRRSSMALAPRMINHTRFAFGSQKSSSAEFATVEIDGLKQVPSQRVSASLGDDLLRRSCLRCHLHTAGSTRWGERRGKGCSSCHVAYSNDSAGKPRSHELVRNVGITACLKCHNSNHVGADFVGLYEKDFPRGFRSPFQGGRQFQRIYGSEQHRLLPDVHFRSGIGCSDCHTLDEIHGTGEIQKSPIRGVKITCEGCHVTGDHPAVLTTAEGKRTLLRGEGRTIPIWNPDTIPHSVPNHREKLKCSACHAAWSFQDYGLHLMLEERPDYWKWSTTAAQNDPQVQDLLARFIGTQSELIQPADGSVEAKPQDKWEAPVAKDWLSGEFRPGAWFRGYTARRWERPPLGLDHTGRVAIMRPIHQYIISHVDEADNLLVDRLVPNTGAGFPALLFNPYSPHTISTSARSCQDCHGCAKSVGIGQGLTGFSTRSFQSQWMPEERIPGFSFVWDALVNEQGDAMQRSTVPGAGPLDRTTLAKLMNPSNRHKALWAQYLKRAGSRRP